MAVNSSNLLTIYYHFEILVFPVHMVGSALSDLLSIGEYVLMVAKVFALRKELGSSFLGLSCLVLV